MLTQNVGSVRLTNRLIRSVPMDWRAAPHLLGQIGQWSFCRVVSGSDRASQSHRSTPQLDGHSIQGDHNRTRTAATTHKTGRQGAKETKWRPAVAADGQATPDAQSNAAAATMEGRCEKVPLFLSRRHDDCSHQSSTSQQLHAYAPGCLSRVYVRECAGATRRARMKDTVTSRAFHLWTAPFVKKPVFGL